MTNQPTTTVFGGPVPAALRLPRDPLRCTVQVPDQPEVPTSVPGTMTRPPSRASASNNVGADVSAVVLAALGAVGFATPPFSHATAKVMTPADRITPASREVSHPTLSITHVASFNHQELITSAPSSE